MDDDELFDEGAASVADAAPVGESRKARRTSTTPPLTDDGALSTPEPRAPRGKRVTKKEQELLDLKSELTKEACKLGATITPVVPTTGAYMFDGAPEAMEALVDMAKDNASALDALRVVAKAAPGITIGRWAAGLAVAAAVDFRRVKPDAVPARALGVTNVWVKTHPKEAEEQGVYIPEPAPIRSFDKL